MAWYNASWGYRKSITIDYTKVGANETNFPVLVNLASDANLAANAQADGDDILFTKSDGTTKLDHEIENYTTGTGALVAWVEVDSLSSSVNTIIYMYYGNAGCASQQNINGTWNSNYQGVWHMKDDPDTSTIQDSTINGNDGTKRAAANPVEATGQIGKGQSFTKTNSDYISTGATGLGFDYTDSWTIEAWVKCTSTYGLIYGKGYYKESPEEHKFYGLNNRGSSNDMESDFWQTPWTKGRFKRTTPAINNDVWHYVVFTYDGTNAATGMINYHDAAVGSTPTSGGGACDASITSTFAPLIGGLRNQDGTPAYNYFQGIMDELRVSNVVKASTYVTTTYNNQYSPSTFYALGTQEEPPAGGAISYGRALLGVGI